MIRDFAGTVTFVSFLLLIAPAMRGGTYEQRFNFNVGTTSFGDGSTLSENFSATGNAVASVQDPNQRELQLTSSAVTGTRTGFLLPNLDPVTPVQAFSVRWNSQVNGNPLADGLSLNFGTLP